MTNQTLYITGSGHSGSTLLDRLLGAHPEVSALGEIHRFSLGLHRTEGPFRCDCGEAVAECAFWRKIAIKVQQEMRVDEETFFKVFETTDHAVLTKASGEKLFNPSDRHQFIPKALSKYLIATVPRSISPIFERLGLLGLHLEHARNSHRLFAAIRKVSGRSIVVDSTKNPARMRSLYLAAPEALRNRFRVIYLKRDGRAVALSRIKRQSVDIGYAARVWQSENRRIAFVLKCMPTVPVLDVRYEALCENPDKEMKRIFDFLGVESIAPDLTAVRHAIGGNPSRFGSTEIRLDEAWRRELTTDQLAQFDQIVRFEAH